MNKIDLFNRIRFCNECNFKYGEIPFFFPLRDQKVMLITACPSIQAMFRPITSIRFFRTICIALFGDANISPDYIDAIHNKIYWTHLHKCYNEEALKSRDFNKISDKCMNIYIEKEIKLLKPKLVIAFGKVVAERLFKEELASEGYKNLDILQNKCLECSKWNTRVFVTDFPKTGLETRFDNIRDVLSKMPGFDFMKQHNGKWSSGSEDNGLNAARGLRVNLNFEIKTIEQLKQTGYISRTDESWLKNVVLPNMKNYEALARLHFFIEDQIRTMLMAVFSHPNNWRIIEEQKYKEFASGKPLNQKNIYKYINERWKEALKDYLLHLLKEHNYVLKMPDGRELNENAVNKLIEKLRELSNIRNCIVHNGGYSPPEKFFGEVTNLKGILWYVNLVHISDEGIKSVISFAEEIISILTDLDSMRFG